MFTIDFARAARESDRLRGANLCGADLRGANLRGADLRDVDLRNANLRGANLDYSVLFFGCKSFDIKCDTRLPAQLAYHLARLDCEDALFLAAIKTPEFIALANKFHRVDECGEIK